MNECYIGKKCFASGANHYNDEHYFNRIGARFSAAFVTIGNNPRPALWCRSASKMTFLSAVIILVCHCHRNNRKGTRRIRILFKAPIIPSNVLSNCVEGKTSLETGLIWTHLQFRAHIQLSREKPGSGIIRTHSGLHETADITGDASFKNNHRYCKVCLADVIHTIQDKAI